MDSEPSDVLWMCVCACALEGCREMAVKCCLVSTLVAKVYSGRVVEGNLVKQNGGKHNELPNLFCIIPLISIFIM